MKKNTKLAILLAMVLSLLVIVPSCAFLHSVFDDKVVTTSDNIKPEFQNQTIPADLGVLTPEQKEKLGDKQIVIAPKDAVKDSTQAVEVTNPNSDTLGNILSIGAGVLGKMFPGVVGIEALGLLLSQRKRQHYSEAVQAVLPSNGSVDVGEAVVSLARAMGFAHSSDASKAAFKGEATPATKTTVS